MTIHIQRFVDRLSGAEARGNKDFSMSTADAKNLHADITRLLLEIQRLRDAASANAVSSDTITVEIKGGSF